jgi:hypothetical protein
MKVKAVFAALFIAASGAQADEIEIVVPENVSEAQGLEAWARMYEVVSHPRCSNCHVGQSDRPMWSGPSYGKARVHGMNIQAGESRIGAETLICSTCHVGTTSDQPHTPPAVDGDWRLVPVEAAWFGRGAVEICNQLRNPETNGGLSFEQIAGH